MTEQLEIKKEHRTQTQKLVYYLIALCVTAIGFSVTQTTGQKLMISQIPLRFAVTCWAFSVFFGLRFLNHNLNIFYDNNLYFDILKGHIPEFNRSTSHQHYAAELVLEKINKAIKKHQYHQFTQELLFYVGIVAFLIWHVLNMYSKTIC
tara:strand:- start:763030 stop:763476 length:447 start_codon:yes stop_codon:yes gene_type:complete